VVGWLIGLKAGRRVLTTRGPLHGMRLRALARGDTAFERYPVVAILLTPTWIAGIHRVGPALYLPTNAAGAALWAGGIGLGAYFIGPPIVDLVGDLGWVTLSVLIAFVAIVIGAEILRRSRRARQ
jgi:membrane protein DedA with SNARE-associated domain